jgi:hypothetical protein
MKHTTLNNIPKYSNHPFAAASFVDADIRTSEQSI